MRKPSPSFVIALIALFVAMFGTAYAASKISGKTIKKESIAGSKLKDAAVGTDKLKDGGVTASKLAAGVIPPAGDSLPKVYMHFDSAGTFIPGESSGVVSINQPVGNVACLDLAAPAKTGGATRGLGAGAPPIKEPQVGVPPAPGALGVPGLSQRCGRAARSRDGGQGGLRLVRLLGRSDRARGRAGSGGPRAHLLRSLPPPPP